jgi:hypothetical protein
VSEKIPAVEAYKTALVNPDDETRAAAVGFLADDVVIWTNFGKAEGVEAAEGLLKEGRAAGLVSGAEWSELAVEDGTATMTAKLGPAAPFAGLEFVFEVAGEKITRVEQQMIPAPPPEATALRLTDSIKAAVHGALDNQTPILMAYRDAGDQIHLSFRGTVEPYSDDQLSLWARDPGAGLPRNIVDRPEVTLFYNDPGTRTTYNFYGRARLESDPDARARIFEASNIREQYMDFRRRGVAIVVDLDRVEGRGPDGRVLMARS